MNAEIKRHIYMPDYQAMGDCRICGHERDKPWHCQLGQWPPTGPDIDHRPHPHGDPNKPHARRYGK